MTREVHIHPAGTTSTPRGKQTVTPWDDTTHRMESTQSPRGKIPYTTWEPHIHPAGSTHTPSLGKSIGMTVAHFGKPVTHSGKVIAHVGKSSAHSGKLLAHLYSVEDSEHDLKNYEIWNRIIETLENTWPLHCYSVEMPPCVIRQYAYRHY